MRFAMENVGTLPQRVRRLEIFHGQKKLTQAPLVFRAHLQWSLTWCLHHMLFSMKAEVCCERSILGIARLDPFFGSLFMDLGIK